jgi:hypothetical protein
MRLSKFLAMIAAAGTICTVASAPAFAEIKGGDRPGSQCERTNKDGTKTSGSCGTVCKGKVITKKGSDDASGVQYVCSAAMARAIGGTFQSPGTLTVDPGPRKPSGPATFQSMPTLSRKAS